MKSWTLAWGPVVAWALFLFVMSSIPGTDLPQLPGVDFDKVIHAGVYALLGALVWRALWLRHGTSLRRTTVLAVALATLFGLSDEFHQTFTPRRSADWRDLVADAVGALVGALVCAAFVSRRRER